MFWTFDAYNGYEPLTEANAPGAILKARGGATIQPGESVEFNTGVFFTSYGDLREYIAEWAPEIQIRPIYELMRDHKVVAFCRTFSRSHVSEITALLTNNGDTAYTVNDGDTICMMVTHLVPPIRAANVTSIDLP